VLLLKIFSIQTIPVAVLSKAWVCGRSSAGIAGSNPAGGMDISSLVNVVLCRQTSLRRADHSSRGDLPSVCVCVTEWDQVQQ